MKIAPALHKVIPIKKPSTKYLAINNWKNLKIKS